MGRAARIGTVTNTGLNTLARFLNAQGKGCERLDIAVAFVTSAGLDQVLHLLKRVAANGEVRVLTGFYQGFTEPKALRALLREQRNTERLTVKVSNDPHFHWKAYLLVKKTTARVVVGSSNLTADGLTQTGELNLALSVGTSSKAFRDVSEVFANHWNWRSVPLTAGVVTEYATWREGAGGSPRHRRVPITKLLTGAKKAEKPQPTEVRYWRVGLAGYFSDETDALLTQTTDWDRRGYGYFSTGQPTFRTGDRVVLFDETIDFLELVQIVDTTRTPTRTPDGWHFAAYRRLPRVARRKLVPNQWRALKGAGARPQQLGLRRGRPVGEPAHGPRRVQVVGQFEEQFGDGAGWGRAAGGDVCGRHRNLLYIWGASVRFGGVARPVPS